VITSQEPANSIRTVGATLQAGHQNLGTNQAAPFESKVDLIQQMENPLSTLIFYYLL
jgi:hypothetical protein